MANTHFSGPVNSEDGFITFPLGSNEYYIRVDPADGNLKIGAGGTVGTNVAIEVDSSGNLTLSDAATDLNVDKITMTQDASTIFKDDDDGSIEISGSKFSDEGGNIKVYGSAHASKANDFELRAGSDTIIVYDDSADLLTFNSDVKIAANSMVITAPDADETLMDYQSAAAGITRLRFSDNGSTTEYFQWTASHGASSTFVLSGVVGGSDVVALTFDRDNETTQFGSAFDLGFFGVSPVSRASAYTQTFSTADKTFSAYTPDDESSAYTGAADSEAKLADLNDLRIAYENLRAFSEDQAGMINSIVDDLQAYGLAQ